MTPILKGRRRDEMCPRLLPINKQPIVEMTLLAMHRRSDLYSAKFAVPIWQVLDRHVLVVDLLVRPDGQVEHAERAGAELVYCCADRPAGTLGRGKRSRGELVAVTGKNYYANAVGGRVLPGCLQDALALKQVPAPGVLGAKLPVLGQGGTGDDEFPVYTPRWLLVDPGQQIIKLSGAEHGLVRVIGILVRRTAVPARVQQEELSRTLREGEVGRPLTVSRRIGGCVVVGKGVIRWDGHPGHVAVPVVLNLVVVDDMDPWQVIADCRPRRGRVDLAVLASVSLCLLALLVWDIDVDEVSEEEHEVRLQLMYPICEMLHARELKRVLERRVWDSRLDAARVHKCVLVVLKG